MSQFVRNLFSIHFVALPGVPGQFAPVSRRPECQILIFVSNQSQFSCIGRQPLTKLSHISRTFWLTETKLRSVRDGFETPATTLWLFWENICRANFLNMFKIPATRERDPVTHARKLRTPANVSRHFGNSLANAVRNLSPTVAAQWDTSLNPLLFHDRWCEFFYVRYFHNVVHGTVQRTI